jgi:transcriptional regulator with XRE-family HTH domain
LAEVYETKGFRDEWDNAVRFHVARNLLHLRRYRRLSQQKLAAAIGTSQSAVARIESAQENITLDTVERFVHGLDGRFFVSIQPAEHVQIQTLPWWELPALRPTALHVRAMAEKHADGLDEYLVWFQVGTGSTSSSALLLESGTTSANRLLR